MTPRQRCQVGPPSRTAPCPVRAPPGDVVGSAAGVPAGRRRLPAGGVGEVQAGLQLHPAAPGHRRKLGGSSMPPSGSPWRLFATPSAIGVPSHLHPVPGAHGGRTAPVPRRSLCRASVWIGSPADARRAPRLCRGDPAESAVDRGSLVRPSGYRGGRDDCQRPPCRPGRQGLPGDGMAVSPAALVVRWTALAERAGSRRRSDGPSGPHEGHHSDGGSARFVPR